MKKVAIVFAQPSPYRVDFIAYLQNRYADEYEICFFYGKRTKVREWDIDFKQLKRSSEVEIGALVIPRKFDAKTIVYSSKIRKSLDLFQPDIVIASEYNAIAIGAAKWAKRNNIPFVTWTDGTPNSESSISRIQLLQRKYIVKTASAFIASSTKSKELQMKYGADEKKIFISTLTVDTDKYKAQNAKRTANNILYVGSLTERKGVDLLLNALVECRDLDFTLNIAGSGSEENNLKAMVNELGLSDRVHFLGFIATDKMRDIYKINDVFVLPSRQDCFGLVITEAMCAGMPLIISKFADGAYDLVDEGYNGYIVDPYNTEDFSNKIRKLLSDHALRNAMGENSLKKVDDVSFESVSKGIIDSIQCAISEEDK